MEGRADESMKIMELEKYIFIWDCCSSVVIRQRYICLNPNTLYLPISPRHPLSCGCPLQQSDPAAGRRLPPQEDSLYSPHTLKDFNHLVLPCYFLFQLSIQTFSSSVCRQRFG